MYINPNTDRSLNSRIETSTSPNAPTLYVRMVDTSDHKYLALGADITVDEARALKAQIEAFLAQQDSDHVHFWAERFTSSAEIVERCIECGEIA